MLELVEEPVSKRIPGPIHPHVLFTKESLVTKGDMTRERTCWLWIFEEHSGYTRDGTHLPVHCTTPRPGPRQTAVRRMALCPLATARLAHPDRVRPGLPGAGAASRCRPPPDCHASLRPGQLPGAIRRALDRHGRRPWRFSTNRPGQPPQIRKMVLVFSETPGFSLLGRSQVLSCFTHSS